MRKIEKFKLDDREIEVRELTPRQIIGLMDQHSQKETAGMGAMLERFAPLATSLEAEQLLDLAPSELAVVWEHFQEVNAVFFGLARKMGLGDKIKEEMSSFLSAEFAASSGPATAKVPGTTVGASS